MGVVPAQAGALSPEELLRRNHPLTGVRLLPNEAAQVAVLWALASREAHELLLLAMTLLSNRPSGKATISLVAAEQQARAGANLLRHEHDGILSVQLVLPKRVLTAGDLLGGGPR